MHLTAAVTREGSWYVARCLEVEVTSQGHTVEQALSNLREALELYLEDALGAASPSPLIAPIDVDLPTGSAGSS
ncbi:HicB family protein [Caldinitratiruptor microaerophilus]|uniref:HicB family protein n=1 Tax=Caldinitratiruptor microaerophilus TaxID=671077 RepID=A0AA35CLZ8_9FIRM|nr:HicB family protein [Caldinitratiruptor microaerophilus]